MSLMNDYVLDTPFQPNLMLVSKGRAYLG